MVSDEQEANIRVLKVVVLRLKTLLELIIFKVITFFKTILSLWKKQNLTSKC